MSHGKFILIAVDIGLLFLAYIGLLNKELSAKIYWAASFPRGDLDDLKNDKEFLFNQALAGLVSLIGSGVVTYIILFR
jgi:hypothetical protein